MKHPPVDKIQWRAWTRGLYLGEISARLWYEAREIARLRAAPYGVEAVERVQVEPWEK